MLVGRSKRKRPFGRTKHRWEVNIMNINCYGNSTCGLDPSGSSQGSVTGSCELGDTRSGSIKVGEFLDNLSDYQLLKECGAMDSKAATMPFSLQ
jgi:hypothetical protein